MCLCTAVFELFCCAHCLSQASVSACIEQVDRPLCSLIAQVPSSSSIQLGETARPHLPLPTPSHAHVLTACAPLLAVTNLSPTFFTPGAPRQAERPAVACRPKILRASAMHASGMRHARTRDVSPWPGCLPVGCLRVGCVRVGCSPVKCVRVGYRTYVQDWQDACERDACQTASHMPLWLRV
jgi:hypothetical protein